MPWLESLGWASSGAGVKSTGREREKENLQQENVGQAIQLKRLEEENSGKGLEAKKNQGGEELRILVTHGQTFLVLPLAMDLC